MPTMNRYTAKLLFQYRVTVAGQDSLRRTCEQRFIMFNATSARRAIAHAKRRGKEAEHVYTNGDGHKVRFEFVGVMELLSLGLECDEDEVWYEIKEMVKPMERKEVVIPPEEELNAFRLESGSKRPKQRIVT